MLGMEAREIAMKHILRTHPTPRQDYADNSTGRSSRTILRTTTTTMALAPECVATNVVVIDVRFMCSPFGRYIGNSCLVKCFSPWEEAAIGRDVVASTLSVIGCHVGYSFAIFTDSIAVNSSSDGGLHGKKLVSFTLLGCKKGLIHNKIKTYKDFVFKLILR